jgi:uncharacterized protein
VDTLKIRLASVPERGLTVDATVSGDEVQPPAHELPSKGVEPLRLGSVTLRGQLSQVDDEYVFHGTVAGACIRVCDRCLEESEAGFRIDVLWTFARGPSRASESDLMDEDMDAEEADATNIVLFQGDEIDLGPPAWEEIVLELPSKFVCNDDCQGLCPKCGANRNTAPCGCPEDDTEVEDESADLKNQGLAKLGEMFPDLMPDRSEE